MIESEPKVLTRMRLCECWGDYLSIEELKEVNSYIKNLQQENQELKKQLEEKENKQKEFIEYLVNEIKEHEKHNLEKTRKSK